MMKKDIAKNMKIIMIVLLIVGMSAVSLSYLLKINLTVVSTIAMVAGIGVYAYTRIEMIEEDIDTTFKLMGFLCLIGIYGMSFGLFYNTLYKTVLEMSCGEGILDGMYEGMAGASIFLSVIVNVFVTFFAFVYLRNEDRMEKIKLLRNLSFTKLEDPNQVMSEDAPDVMLCVDKDTGKEIIWPHMDRYVHMLCLGRATRCYMKSIATRKYPCRTLNLRDEMIG